MTADRSRAPNDGWRRHAHPPLPRSPALTWGSTTVGRYAVEQLESAVRLGQPARRRAAPAWRLISRTGLPRAPAGWLLARTGRRARPDLADSLDRLLDAWPDLAAGAAELPRRAPGRPALLAVRRSVGMMLLLFDGDAPGPPRPLLVAKPADAAGVDRERDALQRTAALPWTPRLLGEVGEWTVQEGLTGRALIPPPLRPGRTRRWPHALGEACRAVEALGAHTATGRRPGELEPIEAALASGRLGPAAEERVGRARAAVLGCGTSVVRHGDLSPQNILLRHGRVTGLIDWEVSRADGAPGFDVWNAALSYLEVGVGRRRASPRALLRAHVAALEGGFHAAIHLATERCLQAAGVDPGLARFVGLAFVARRLGQRLLRPERYATDADLVAMLVEMMAGGEAAAPHRRWS